MTTVTLAAEQEALVMQLVADGSFQSADEAVNFVVSQALSVQTAYSEAEREHVQSGIDQLGRGELITQTQVEAFLVEWRRKG